MAPPTRTPPAKWIEAGLRALAAGGPEAVRIDPLAKTLGATRGSFYWHFADRGALLEAMLDTWERMSIDEVIEQVEDECGDARARVQLAGALTFSDEIVPIDLAVRDWARRDAAVAERLRRVDNRRMDYARSQFRTFCPDDDEVEARSMIAFSLAVAKSIIAADHGERTRLEVLELATRRLLD
ncbi:TetR/AcrR family transcriptional regulator [Saccharopolyspora indica]|uniref:TetR/AcrR family transcriptional regulator n=1 Tax=Saccharopolyspora indica TaxID=1229659 RepID=UPI0022EAB1B2|nr:TetR/AcrR family transcriptional regulator [Saccharopolyspora indica]MDA3648866.1 helix-turn-helix domain containing protein [Saccharopolyspora indica]